MKMGDVIDITRARERRIARVRTKTEQQPKTVAANEVRADTSDGIDEFNRLSDTLRDEFGRFRTNAIQILEIMRKVATHAAQHLYDPEKGPVDPSRVSEDKWDQARRAFEGEEGRIAAARQLCVRLRKITGYHYRWPEWLAIAFDDDKDPDKVLAGLARRPAASLTDEQVIFALRAIAGKLTRRSYATHEYDRFLERWRVEEERAGRGSNAALERMPNSDQIITYCGSWANAMRLAGLEPPDENDGRQQGCPVPDAIAYHFAQRGYLPTRKQLEKFATDQSFSLAAISRTRWHTWLDRGLDRIADFPDLPDPAPYGTPAPDGWEPIDIDVQLPPRGTRWYGTRAILDAYEQFLTLAAKRHRPHTQRVSRMVHRCRRAPRPQRSSRKRHLRRTRPNPRQPKLARQLPRMRRNPQAGSDDQ
jgi:hypothetical protein